MLSHFVAGTAGAMMGLSHGLSEVLESSLIVAEALVQQTLPTFDVPQTMEYSTCAAKQAMG